jgi:3-hydroxyacyl-CoA dehydrogenase/enoyl-CoA hydratase/3-hydroxybutyryl-CoA epimerase
MGERAEAISLSVDTDKIAWLTFDQPDAKVNLLTTEVMAELDHRLSELESRIATGQPLAVVVRSGKPGTFIAGADVGEIAAIENAADGETKSREGQRIFRRLERLTIPTIAAIDGLCLGGGTELALACEYRVASDRGTTRIGQPEVRLGIIPGFGGSVRLPRLLGIQRALKMILGGSASSADRALRSGLVDRVLRHDRFEDATRQFVREVLFEKVTRRERKLSLWNRFLEHTAPGRRILFTTARKQAAKRAQGRYPAPLKAIDVVERTLDLPIDEALKVEAEGLGQMAATEVSRNLVRIFLLQQAARRALPHEALDERQPVEHAAVLGAGVMGGAIAELIAANEVPVILKDIDQDALDLGLRHASALLKKAGERGIMAREEVGLRFALIHGTLAYDNFEDVDLVIEAVVERMPVKQAVLREAEEVIGDDAVFATNTSSLSVTELASAAGHPERVVGLHFFNPVHRMPLVEVIRTDESSEKALAAAFGFVLDMDKTPVLVADRPGFLVNRLLAPYLNEAGYLLEEGAGVEQIDKVLLEFGMPMGPCRLLDEIGFDVAEHVAREMEDAFGERMRPASAVSRLKEDGRLGRKNERGFYTYSRGRQRGVDREVARVLAANGTGTAASTEEIRDRCVYLLVNEAAHALEEGVVAAADHVDLAMVMGTGFPPFRGGLLRWADQQGVDQIIERLSSFEARFGSRFGPAPRLHEMAESGQTFTHPA